MSEQLCETSTNILNISVPNVEIPVGLYSVSKLTQQLESRVLAAVSKARKSLSLDPVLSKHENALEALLCYYDDAVSLPQKKRVEDASALIKSYWNPKGLQIHPEKEKTDCDTKEANNSNGVCMEKNSEEQKLSNKSPSDFTYNMLRSLCQNGLEQQDSRYMFNQTGALPQNEIPSCLNILGNETQLLVMWHQKQKEVQEKLRKLKEYIELHSVLLGEIQRFEKEYHYNKGIENVECLPHSNKDEDLGEMAVKKIELDNTDKENTERQKISSIKSVVKSIGRFKSPQRRGSVLSKDAIGCKGSSFEQQVKELDELRKKVQKKRQQLGIISKKLWHHSTVSVNPEESNVAEHSGEALSLDDSSSPNESCQSNSCRFFGRQLLNDSECLTDDDVSPSKQRHSELGGAKERPKFEFEKFGSEGLNKWSTTSFEDGSENTKSKQAQHYPDTASIEFSNNTNEKITEGLKNKNRRLTVSQATVRARTLSLLGTT